jgi:hypothetical protein
VSAAARTCRRAEGTCGRRARQSLIREQEHGGGRSDHLGELSKALGSLDVSAQALGRLGDDVVGAWLEVIENEAATDLLEDDVDAELAAAWRPLRRRRHRERATSAERANLPTPPMPRTSRSALRSAQRSSGDPCPCSSSEEVLHVSYDHRQSGCHHPTTNEPNRMIG